MTLDQWLHKAGRGLLDLLYPPHCVGCRQFGQVYCISCRDVIPRVAPPICSLCGSPTTGSQLCIHCASAPLRIDGIRSVAFFEGSLRQAIHQLKYSYAREIAAPLGDMLIQFWQTRSALTDVIAPDVIIPVPLHSRRQRERGYNQSALLAEHLGRAVGVPVLSLVLFRFRYTVSQTRLNAKQRQQNVKDAFACAGDEIRGKRVLLIDDVCTTGATLEASSIALKAAGASSVWALTLARAR